MRRTLNQWGTGLYFVVAPLFWLIASYIYDGRVGAGVGAIVALVGVGLAALASLGLQTTSSKNVFFLAMTFAAFPLGILAWANGGSGFVWLWTMIWIGAPSFVLAAIFSGISEYHRRR